MNNCLDEHFVPTIVIISIDIAKTLWAFYTKKILALWKIFSNLVCGHPTCMLVKGNVKLG